MEEHFRRGWATPRSWWEQEGCQHRQNTKDTPKLTPEECNVLVRARYPVAKHPSVPRTRHALDLAASCAWHSMQLASSQRDGHKTLQASALSREGNTLERRKLVETSNRDRSTARCRRSPDKKTSGSRQVGNPSFVKQSGDEPGPQKRKSSRRPQRSSSCCSTGKRTLRHSQGHGRRAAHSVACTVLRLRKRLGGVSVRESQRQRRAADCLQQPLPAAEAGGNFLFRIRSLICNVCGVLTLKDGLTQKMERVDQWMEKPTWQGHAQKMDVSLAQTLRFGVQDLLENPRTDQRAPFPRTGPSPNSFHVPCEAFRLLLCGHLLLFFTPSPPVACCRSMFGSQSWFFLRPRSCRCRQASECALHGQSPTPGLASHTSTALPDPCRG